MAGTLFAVLTTRWLPAADRGVVVVILTTSSLLMLAGSLGVATVGRRLVATAEGMHPGTYLHLVRRMTAAHILTTMILGLGTLSVSGGLPGSAAGIAFVAFAPMAFYGYMCRELLHGLGRHASAVYVEVVPAFGMLVWIAGAEVLGGLTLRSTLMAIVAGGTAQIVYVAVATRSYSGLRPRPAGWLRMLRVSLPALGSSLGSAVVVRGDRLILGAFAGPAAVGVYGLAATFSELLWVVPMTLGQFAFRRASVHGHAPTSRAWLLVLGTTTGLAVLVATLGGQVIALFGRDYEQAAGLLPVLCLAAVPMASFHFDSAVLKGVGDFRIVFRITYVGVGLLLATCFVLVPVWDAYGAALASAIGYSGMGVLARMAVSRHRAPNTPISRVVSDSVPEANENAEPRDNG